jgi:hypothetical protein
MQGSTPCEAGKNACHLYAIDPAKNSDIAFPFISAKRRGNEWDTLTVLSCRIDKKQ